MAAPQLLGAGSSIYDTQKVYTVQGHPVGAFGVLNGLGYVWCSYTGSTGLTRGEPLVSAAPFNAKNLATATSSISVGMTRIAGITAGAAISANAFVGGFLIVVDGGAEGTKYRIRDHTAFTASSADGVVNLENSIEVAGDANTEVTLIQNKFANVRASLGLGQDPFVGVPNVTVPAGDSTPQYFWAQRVGYCGVFVKGSPKRGTSVVVSEGTDARLESVREYIEVDDSRTGGGRTMHELNQTGIVGQMATDAVDGEIQIVDLQNAMF